MHTHKHVYFAYHVIGLFLMQVFNFKKDLLIFTLSCFERISLLTTCLLAKNMLHGSSSYKHGLSDPVGSDINSCSCHTQSLSRGSDCCHFYPQTTGTSQLHPPPSSQQDLKSAPNPAATISIFG